MNRNRKSVFYYIHKWVSRIIFAICIFLIIALGGVRLIGLKPYVITSGSMIPEYNVGSIVYVQETEPESLKIGDDISFYLDNQVVATHRIREVDIENRNVKTYGINNKDSNGNQINDATPVDFDYIIGKVKFSLPMLGYIYLFLRTTAGKAVLVMVLAILIISQVIHTIIFHMQRRKGYEKKRNKS